MVIAYHTHTKDEYRELMTAQNPSFTVKPFGDIRHFLGIQIRRNEKQFSLNQRIYPEVVGAFLNDRSEVVNDFFGSWPPATIGEREKLPNNHH